MSKFTIENVKSFRGFDVIDGEVSLSDSEYIDILDDVYGDVIVCGMKYSQGRALEALDPIAFNCGKGEHESSIQSELEKQLDREDDSDIEFVDEMDEENEDE